MGWGHPVTSGIPNIDHFLSVNDMEPSNADNHYSEKVIKLKGLSICVEKPKLSNDQTNKSKFGMLPSTNSYLCPQSLFKIHPDFDIIVNEILKKDLNGMIYFLTLHTKSDEYFLSRLEQTLGNNINRVKIIQRVPSEEFPLLLGSADVILDVPHWSGGKTSLECLSVGMPVVHMPGEFMRGRHTLAFYKKMNLLDCVVNNNDEYVNMSYKIANDDRFNKKIKNKILKSSHKLFDDKKSINEISNVFEELIINKYNMNE
jgi:predicted O-linked N-acetylglucosamine transferase (SPINDLY family)